MTRALPLVALLAACGSAGDDYANLERRIEALERRAREDAAARVAPPPVEAAATPESTHARALLDELTLLGKPSPGLDDVRWIGAVGGFGAGKATLLVFFTVEHPGAPDALTHVAALLAANRARGLAVVGVAAAASDAAVRGLVRELRTPFPYGVDPNGAVARAWKRSAPLSAALVTDGNVVWTGAPTGATDATLDKHLSGSGAPAPVIR
jgi:hypothetical protein